MEAQTDEEHYYHRQNKSQHIKLHDHKTSKKKTTHAKTNHKRVTHYSSNEQKTNLPKEIKQPEVTKKTSFLEKIKTFGTKNSKDHLAIFYSSIKLLVVITFLKPLTTSTCPIEHNANVNTTSHCPAVKLVK